MYMYYTAMQQFDFYNVWLPYDREATAHAFASCVLMFVSVDDILIPR